MNAELRVIQSLVLHHPPSKIAVLGTMNSRDTNRPLATA